MALCVAVKVEWEAIECSCPNYFFTRRIGIRTVAEGRLTRFICRQEEVGVLVGGEDKLN